MILYRPVGKTELKLIEQAKWLAFPPRLPEQPIFYPVLTLDYAVKIARDWNAKDPASGFEGYVVKFTVDPWVTERYPVQRAGGSRHEELWVPAEELADFNQHIVGRIEVIESFIRPV